MCCNTHLKRGAIFYETLCLCDDATIQQAFDRANDHYLRGLVIFGVTWSPVKSTERVDTETLTPFTVEAPSPVLAR